MNNNDTRRSESSKNRCTIRMFLLICCTSAPLMSQEVVKGSVITMDSIPVCGATVHLIRLDLDGITDTNGVFSIGTAAAGTPPVSVSRVSDNASFSGKSFILSGRC